MIERAYRLGLFTLLQASIVVGIALMPIALALSRLGITLPINRAIELLDEAHEDAKDAY
ncbi:hypothetical protein K0C01_04105 [Salinarchaeum sp. IM2453]|uniref:hypothetical protein n=1 Tax=Salinarchaeum sp. IM2453 TaxID=2862870 RepID=UPI001C836B5C|nr:hypothetical protein [Salinarchaeum sp. IM2453]QZA89334.1 hypothetical protein K0C01_04105 [Salinarchaeum sp. IM2453]